MATLITLLPGQFPFVYLGLTPLSLASQPWYTAANVNKIYAVGSTRKGYVTGTPGNGFGATQLLPPMSGQPPNGYILDVKATFQLDLDLFGLQGGGDVLVLAIPMSTGSPQQRRYVLNASPTSLGAPRFFNAQGGEIAGTLTVALDGGTPTDYAGFNAAVASLTEADYAANTHYYTLSFSLNTNVAGSMELPIY